MKYPIGYVEMLKALEAKGLLPDFNTKAQGLSIVSKARELDKKRARLSSKRPARLSDARKTQDKPLFSPEKTLTPTKTLLDLLRAFKSAYAATVEANKKDKSFRSKNKEKTYRPEARDLLILRAMARKFSAPMTGEALPVFIKYCLERNRSITVKNFEIWSKTKWKNRKK